MTDEEQIDSARAPDGEPLYPRHEPAAITPDEEPSALGRGVRIFERLRRRR
jgi:hypothetical protein